MDIILDTPKVGGGRTVQDVAIAGGAPNPPGSPVATQADVAVAEAAAISAAGTASNAAIAAAITARIVVSSSAAPAAAVGNRGLIYITQGGAGVADLVQVSVKKADDTYAWVTMIG